MNQAKPSQVEVEAKPGKSRSRVKYFILCHIRRTKRKWRNWRNGNGNAGEMLTPNEME